MKTVYVNQQESISAASWPIIKTYLLANNISHAFVTDGDEQWNVRVTPRGTMLKSAVASAQLRAIAAATSHAAALKTTRCATCGCAIKTASPRGTEVCSACYRFQKFCDDVGLELREMKKIGMRVPAKAIAAAADHMSMREYATSMGVTECADLLIQLADCR